jgi:HAD superfamily hydrolase (TIGR01509 family)
LLRTEDILVTGMAELLGRLRGEEFAMGIVTSSHREHFDIIHERSGLLSHMDFAVVREDYEQGKPHPGGYLMGIERANAGVECCMAVEDSPRGAAAARAAGLACVFFDPGGAGADREVGVVRAREETVEGLETVLREWGEED